MLYSSISRTLEQWERALRASHQSADSLITSSVSEGRPSNSRLSRHRLVSPLLETQARAVGGTLRPAVSVTTRRATNRRAFTAANRAITWESTAISCRLRLRFKVRGTSLGRAAGVLTSRRIDRCGRDVVPFFAWQNEIRMEAMMVQIRPRTTGCESRHH